MNLSEIQIDHATLEDIPLVFDSWARSYRKSREHRRTPSSAFHAWNRPRMIALIDRGASVFVARDKADPAFLYGWLCAEPGVLHYAYVKRAFEGNGVGELLYEIAEDTFGYDFARYTHRGAWEPWLKLKGLAHHRLTDREVFG